MTVAITSSPESSTIWLYRRRSVDGVIQSDEQQDELAEELNQLSKPSFNHKHQVEDRLYRDLMRINGELILPRIICLSKVRIMICRIGNLSSLILRTEEGCPREQDKNEEEHEGDENDNSGDGEEEWDLEVCCHEEDLKERKKALVRVLDLESFLKSAGDQYKCKLDEKRTAQLLVFTGGGF